MVSQFSYIRFRFFIPNCLESGKLYSWGWGSYCQLGLEDTDDSLLPSLIETLEEQTVTDISCGIWHSLALSTNGKVFRYKIYSILTCSFGWNEFGQLGQADYESRSIPTVVSALFPYKYFHFYFNIS